jgi:hypothetical protein
MSDFLARKLRIEILEELRGGRLSHTSTLSNLRIHEQAEALADFRVRWWTVIWGHAMTSHDRSHDDLSSLDESRCANIEHSIANDEVDI